MKLKKPKFIKDRKEESNINWVTCYACGFENGDDDGFCGWCGAPIVVDSDKTE